MNSQIQGNDKPPINILHLVGKFFKGVWSFLATLIMVGIITGCIVGSVLTVFVLQSMNAAVPVDLNDIKLGFTSKIYSVDKKTGNPKELMRLYKSDNNRIWVDLDKISPHARDAMVAIEDKRFYTHSGVDWKRSAAALIALFNPSAAKGGGSTIHQQLIKNVTKNDAYRIDRKISEIFQAIDLADRYSHNQVLEAYMNVVPFGAGTNGIESAANTYFDKSAVDLTLAESASIVGITQYPGLWNPFTNPYNNKRRQVHVLMEMFEQKLITYDEFEKALYEPLNFKQSKHLESLAAPQSYFIDHVINEVLADLVDKFEYTRADAYKDLYEGGYNVYITMDQDIQKIMEDFYISEEKFPPISREDYPQSAATVLDPYTGALLGVVGGIGEKKDARTFNRATMAKRQPGSTFKPIGPYSLALEYDRITWSTIIEDAESHSDPSNPNKIWPTNYYPGFRGPMTVNDAIRNSVNTVAVKVGELVTPQSIFDFLYNDLQMTSLVENRDGSSDINISPMALGGVTDGVTPLELTAAYQMFVNGGKFIPPHSYTKVIDSEGRIILEADTTPRQVLSEDTAVLLNKLLQQVVSNGTGTAAKIPNMPTGGKTGTTDNNVDQWFVGFTPYYLAQVWLGYDEPNTYDKYGKSIPNSVSYHGFQYPTPYLFRDLVAPMHEDLEPKEFLDSERVVSKSYCTVSGNLSGPNCPGVLTGWYKTSRIPEQCTSSHIVVQKITTPPDGGGTATDESSTTAGDPTDKPVIPKLQ